MSDEPDKVEVAGSAEAPDGELEAELKQIREKAALEARARCAAIVTCREAEGRDSLARHLAFATEIPAAEAIELLRAAPIDAPATLRPNGKTTADEFAAHAARSAAGGSQA